MDEIVRGILEWALSTEWAPYVTLAFAIIGVVAKVIAILPVTVTEKLPDWFMVGLNYLGSNYGNVVKTDMKGNPLKGETGEGTYKTDRQTG